MFNLYPTANNVFSFEDYGVLLDECARLGTPDVLEFGPGASTLALVEAGCKRIVTCEYDDRWGAKAAGMFKKYPQVELKAYRNEVNVQVKGLRETDRFGLAFVDSPKGTDKRKLLPGQENCSRLNTMLFALSRAPVVLLHDAKRYGEAKTLERLAAQGYHVEVIQTKKGIARVSC